MYSEEEQSKWLNAFTGHSPGFMSWVGHASQVSDILIALATLFWHPHHKLCVSLGQSGNVVQAVFVPSMPWWKPANADALGGYADCDPVQLEAALAQVPVVHKQPEAATGSNMKSTAAGQAFNPANQVYHDAEQGCHP